MIWKRKDKEPPKGLLVKPGLMQAMRESRLTLNLRELKIDSKGRRELIEMSYSCLGERVGFPYFLKQRVEDLRTGAITGEKGERIRGIDALNDLVTYLKNENQWYWCYHPQIG